MQMFALVLLSAIIAILVSCGGSAEGQLSSSIVTASLNQTSVDADTAFWIGNNQDGICDGYEVRPTEVNLTLSINPIPGVPDIVQPYPVRVERIDIIYDPADNVTPLMDTVYKLVSVEIKPGVGVTIPVVILDQVQKENLISTYNLLRTNPNMPKFRYYVILRIHLREVSTDDKTTVQAGLNMNVSDFISPNECGGAQ